MLDSIISKRPKVAQADNLWFTILWNTYCTENCEWLSKRKKKTIHFPNFWPHLTSKSNNGTHFLRTRQTCALNFLYIWLMKRYRISLNGICFIFDPMFMFNKCGEVLGTSDITWRFIFTQSKISEFTHFKMETQAARHFGFRYF